MPSGMLWRRLLGEQQAYPPESPPLFAYQFDNAGNLGEDDSGNGYHLTNINGVTQAVGTGIGNGFAGVFNAAANQALSGSVGKPGNITGFYDVSNNGTAWSVRDGSNQWQYKLNLSVNGATLHRFISSGFARSRYGGFRGVATDGVHIYLSPYQNKFAYHGNVLRVPCGDFSFDAVEVVDLTTINAGYKGFSGIATDGNHVYLAPDYDGGAYHGYFIRIPCANFVAGAVEVINLTGIDANYKGFVGVDTDGSYAYLSPNNNGVDHGNFIRVPCSNFVAGAVEVIDLTVVNPNYKGFGGVSSDGNNVYLAPYGLGIGYGNLVRVPCASFIGASVQAINMLAINSNLRKFVGIDSDGTYVYLSPFATGTNGLVVRAPCNSFVPGSLQFFQINDAQVDTRRFTGVVSDGTHVYLSPYAGASLSRGTIIRIDCNNFNINGREYIKTEDINADFCGFWGIAHDGTYIYLSSYDNAGASGRSGNLVRASMSDFTLGSVVNLPLDEHQEFISGDYTSPTVISTNLQSELMGISVNGGAYQEQSTTVGNTYTVTNAIVGYDGSTNRYQSATINDIWGFTGVLTRSNVRFLRNSGLGRNWNGVSWV